MALYIGMTPEQRTRHWLDILAAEKKAEVKACRRELDRLAGLLKANRDNLDAGRIGERAYRRRRAALVHDFRRFQAIHLDAYGVRYQPALFTGPA